MKKLTLAIVSAALLMPVSAMASQTTVKTVIGKVETVDPLINNHSLSPNLALQVLPFGSCSLGLALRDLPSGTCRVHCTSVGLYLLSAGWRNQAYSFRMCN